MYQVFRIWLDPYKIGHLFPNPDTGASDSPHDKKNPAELWTKKTFMRISVLDPLGLLTETDP